MKLHQILKELQNWAPFQYQESYDNSGLLVGSVDSDIHKILISLDITESVIKEAIEGRFNLIISHHPIIFSGIKSLTGKNEEERVLLSAIKNDIAIIAMHTNLDNVHHGVNSTISKKLGLLNTEILKPKNGTLKKLTVFIPEKHHDIVRKAVFEAGAGHIGNYKECSFGVSGTGTFKAEELSNPFVGVVNQFHEESEIRMETVFPANLQSKVIQAIIKSHPYEEPAYDIYSLDNKNLKIGAGIIGDLPEPMEEKDFLNFLKEQLQTNCVRHTSFRNKKVSKVALCGGSGSFLIKDAKAAKADIFITGDVKYHDFFEANNHLMIADVGHYESEQFTKDLIGEFLIKIFPNFAVQISEHHTNPIKYF
ncbi:MAG: Nif3-like dinuclear metal center hexameric protein [Bacteroidales bacterium]|nr:Nif3-like dinuclear metal center hexameric protein [Bacteroidales bacterium]